MGVPNQRTRSVQLHDFAMTPSADVPRSVFNLSHGRKLAFGFSWLIPVFCQPTIPGDTWNCSFGIAARTAVPIVPVQDNWKITFMSFFCPMRIVWTNAPKFWGEQESPGDSTNYTMPTCTSPAGGYAVGSLQDYLGLPTTGQLAGANTFTHNNLPVRVYNKIYNEWIRDENLQTAVNNSTSDGPDAPGSFTKLPRGKRFDYITQALPWPQKGNTAVTLPLAGTAPVIGVSGQPIVFLDGGAGLRNINTANGATTLALSATAAGSGGLRLALSNTNVVADLSAATGPTLNAFRTQVALQQYLEADARNGTRYNEYVWGMFRVRTQDSRLNRPEYIGGGSAEILTTPIPQMSATGLTGGTTPAGNLAASGSTNGGGSFTYSTTEHGYIMTLACATADLTYSQGVQRFWKDSTRYDWPVPILANLGEQALYNFELYADGSANDTATFGYVPRFDHWRTIPSMISGIYRPTAAGNLAYWHSSQMFASLPTLNGTFISDDAKTVVQRNFAAGAATADQQILAELYFQIKCARALPLYGKPGLTRL